MFLVSFLKNTFAEAKTLSKPTKKEVYITTAAVLVAVVVTSVMITLFDLVISKTITFVLGL